MCSRMGQGVWEGKCCPNLPCSSLSDDKSWEGGGINSHVTLSRRDSEQKHVGEDLASPEPSSQGSPGPAQAASESELLSEPLPLHLP